MKRGDWTRTTAKRIVAEAALRAALEKIEAVRPTGGPQTSTYGGANDYKVARHLAQHAADQLRLAEGE